METIADAAEPSESVWVEYGRLMRLVQQWELAQTILWWASQREKQSRPSGDFDTPQSQKAIRQIQAAYLKMTAQQTREAIAHFLDDRTREDLPGLFSERNRLAHRFLREGASEAGYQNGTLAELQALGGRFLRSTNGLMAAVATAGPTYEGPVLPHWPELARRVVHEVSAGNKIPRDPNDQ